MARQPKERTKYRTVAEFAGVTFCYMLLMTHPSETGYRLAATLRPERRDCLTYTPLGRPADPGPSGGLTWGTSCQA
jgi:hypothetical protein